MDWHVSGEVVMGVEDFATNLTRKCFVGISPPSAGVFSAGLRVLLQLKRS